MRKIYESLDDRLDEQDLFRDISTKMNCMCITTPQLCAIDGLICRLDGSLWAIAEIKIRSKTSNKYTTYLFDCKKHKDVITISEKLRVPALLIVKFTDCVMATTLKKHYFNLDYLGRTDRNDPKDKKSCFHIPMEEFRLVL